jgi:hypothetical protein
MPVLGWEAGGEAAVVVPGEDDLQISSLACVRFTASKEDCCEGGLMRDGGLVAVYTVGESCSLVRRF